MAGLLDTFTISKRGLNVQQSNINTSSHNIANANTVGYSRQRSVIETTRPFGGASRFDCCTVGQVGTGAQVTAIQRVRDLFLDYQVREKTTESGTLNMKYQYLYQTENILNDSSDAGIQNALNEFFNAFQEISKAPEKTSNKDVAISQASALADTLNSKYTQLEKKQEEAQKLLGQNVQEINDILDSINSLNVQIKSVAAIGMTPNDLMDKRDNLLDELSSKFGINVDRDKNETINLTAAETSAATQVTNADGTKSTVNKLVSSNAKEECLRFSYISEVKASADGKTLTVTYDKLGDSNNKGTITINCADKKEADEVTKTLLQTRVLITDQKGVVKDSTGTEISSSSGLSSLKNYLFTSSQNNESSVTNVGQGEIAGNQAAQKEIQEAMDELDKLAISLAYTVNAIQTGDIGDGNTTLTDKAGNKYKAELIFVNKNRSDDEGINAKNISINQELVKDSSKLICGENTTDVSGDKAGTRALAIASIASLKIDYSSYKLEDYINTDMKRKDFFTETGITFKESTNLNLKTDKEGTNIKDKYVSINSTLGLAVKGAKESLTTVASELESFEEQRLSISGVSLDEEMTDLITFQHAYQANAKMINTIDQLLDVVINGLKA